jgi:hypothetical protein
LPPAPVTGATIDEPTPPGAEADDGLPTVGSGVAVAIAIGVAIDVGAPCAVTLVALIPKPSEWPLLCKAYWIDAVRVTALLTALMRSCAFETLALTASVPIAAVNASSSVLIIGATCVSRLYESASVDDFGNWIVKAAPASL